MYPDPLISFAAITKQASCGPKLVANMPAPHGHQVGFNGLLLPPYLFMSRISKFLHAWRACSSPGYEILGIG